MNKNEILKKARAYDVMIEIFALMLAGGERDKLRAAELIHKLSPQERRDLRAGLQTLDYLLDDVFLSEQREKRIEKQLPPNSNRKDKTAI